MGKIKICYVIVNCKITGPMNQTLNIIKNLDSKKFEVSFITLFDEEENNSMIEEYKKVIKNHTCLNLNKIQSILYGKRILKKKLEKIKPDVIHALGMPPYRLSLAYKNAKHLVTLRNYMFEDYPSYYNKIIGPILAFLDMNLIKRLYKKGKTFVTCSRSLSAIYEEKENIKLQFIRNGVDTSKYIEKNYNEVNSLRENLSIPKDKIVFIYTGPFIERKDQESAIKGIINSKVNDKVVLVLCGDGTNYDYLVGKYRENKNIIFTGKVKNVSEYLRASDIYLSVSKSEGMPNSVLEAMATGIGVVLSNIPQHLELFEISEQIGLNYQLGDTKELSEAIEKIISLDYKNMGQLCKRIVDKHLTSAVMSRHYQELYEKLSREGDKNETK